jgi:hypothetical protein
MPIGIHIQQIKTFGGVDRPIYARLLNTLATGQSIR